MLKTVLTLALAVSASGVAGLSLTGSPCEQVCSGSKTTETTVQKTCPVEQTFQVSTAALNNAMKGDIIDVATGPGMTEVSTLVAAIKAAGLVEALKGEGPFTVFAPTNAAFAKLPAGTVETLLKPENKEKLTAILLYHVHKGAAVKAADVKTMSLSTLNGKALNVVVADGKVKVNNATVIKTDVVASNGIIHWVDTVILPE